MFDYTSFLVLGPFNHFLPIAIDKIKGIESLPQTLNFQITISLQPNVVDLRYVKLGILID